MHVEESMECCGMARLYISDADKPTAEKILEELAFECYNEDTDKTYDMSGKEYERRLDEDTLPKYKMWGLVMAITTQREKKSAKALDAAGFRPSRTFLNPNSFNTLTVWFRTLPETPKSLLK